MYLGKITTEIVIDGRKLNFLESLRIDKDVNKLSDTATIVIPGARGSITLEVEQKIRRGMPISIACGYEDELLPELEGKVLSVRTDNRITLQVEDGMFALRVPTKNRVLKEVTANEVLGEILSGAGLDLSIVPGKHTEAIRFDKFTLRNVTAFEALAKLKRQTGYNYYLRGKELHIQLKHLTDRPGKVVPLDFRYQVEKSNLKYIRADERIMEIEVIGIDRENKRYPVRVGQSGGDKFTMYRYNVTDPGALKAYGKEMLKRHQYTGFEGSITGWLTPYYTVGDSLRLINPNYTDREGTYMAERVLLEASRSGGRRSGFLGIKEA